MSGGGLCPETSRQQMIGMMYLVLIALLAMNVPSNVLDAFDKVNEALLITKRQYEENNDNTLEQFVQQNAINPEKVGSWKRMADELSTQADKIVQILDTSKYILVMVGDGKEAANADRNHLIAKGNMDIANQLISSEVPAYGYGKLIKESISAFREVAVKLVDSIMEGKDSASVNYLQETLATDDPPPSEGVTISWEMDRFTHIPANACLALLTKSQVDIRQVQDMLLKFLYGRIDAKSIKVNKVTAQVIPRSTHILRGGQYEAKVFMAAMDTTQIPEITVNGQKLEVKDGVGIYRTSASSVGEKTWQANIKYPIPGGGFGIATTEKQTYSVAEPSLVVSPTKMNVFYAGVPNPVRISVPGVLEKDLIVDVSNAKKRKVAGGYEVFPTVVGKNSVVSVSANILGRTTRIGSVSFRVKRIPDPVAKVANKTTGSVSKGLLQIQKKVYATLENFDFQMKFDVISFTVSAQDADGFMVDVPTKGAAFTAKQKQLFKNLSRGRTLFISDIKAKGGDGTTRSLNTITFRIK